MIKLTDIYNKVSSLIKGKYGYDVYGNEVIEGYNTPSFFLEIKPKSITVESAVTKKFIYTILITYNQKVASELDNLTKVDDMMELFGNNLPLSDGKSINLSSFTYEFTGTNANLLKFSMETEYYDKVDPKTEPYEIATEININSEMKGE